MKQSNTHYSALDAMRGIAALTVVFAHLISDLRGSPYDQWIPKYVDNSIFNGMSWGISPVMFFFVLSGFVLSLSKDATDKSFFPSFVIKRIARIWVPYVVAMIGFIVLARFTSSYDKGVYEWANHAFRWDFEWTDVFRHLLLIGPTYEIHYMGASWSLVHELRISLIFPLFLFALSGKRWWSTALIAAILFYAGHWLLDKDGMSIYSTSFQNTLYVMGMFAVGMGLASHKDMIIKAMTPLRRDSRIALLLISVSFYIGNFWSLGISFLPWYPIGIVLGCAGLVCLGITSRGANPIVHSAAAQWLGRVSYSLYLWHPVVLLVCFRCLGNYPPAVVWAVAIPATLVIAEISYRLTERPSIALGKRVAGMIKRPNVELAHGL